MGHSWQRVCNIPYIAYITFSEFCPTPFSCCLQPSLPLLFFMSCFIHWIGDRASFDVLFHLMILWIHVGPWYLSTRMILVYVLHTYTQIYTAHSGTNRLTYQHEYILTSPALCSLQLSVLTHSLPRATDSGFLVFAQTPMSRSEGLLWRGHNL